VVQLAVVKLACRIQPLMSRQPGLSKRQGGKQLLCFGTTGSLAFEHRHYVVDYSSPVFRIRLFDVEDTSFGNGLRGDSGVEVVPFSPLRHGCGDTVSSSRVISIWRACLCHQKMTYKISHVCGVAGGVEIDNAFRADTSAQGNFQLMGISEREAQEKFGFLLDAFQFGPPPHGGIAFGWDRTCMLLSGGDSIRDVIAFPKTASGGDPLTGAPSVISAAQRKEAGIDARPGADS
jgi:hypothetical protein